MDENLSEVSIIARLAFIGLWTLADKEGRLEDRPRYIKANLFPYEDADMDAILSELERKPFITRYEAGVKKYIQINNFTKHQRPHNTEAESDIPPPDSGITDRSQLNNSYLTVTKPLPDSEATVISREKKSGKEVEVKDQNQKLFPVSGETGEADSFVEADRRRTQKRQRRPYPPEFESFWKAYPRQVEKRATFEAWRIVVKEFPPEDVMAAAEEYAAQCRRNRTDENFIKHPATFLRKDRWAEYCLVGAPSGSQVEPCESRGESPLEPAGREPPGEKAVNGL